MRILWLYQYMPNYNFDHWLHMDIAEAMNKIPGIEVLCYGPRLHESNPKLTLRPYHSHTTINYLYSKWQFDVIVICTKSRMFMNYLPMHSIDNTTGEIVQGEWLPLGFTEFNKTKKVVLEEDYHYEGPDKWYKERGIDAILQRHYVNIEQGTKDGGYGMKHIFFPFSVDTNTFRDYEQTRINKIKYTGSTNNKYYLDRVAAKAILHEIGLLATQEQKSENVNYINDLNKYTVHLSGQSKYYILPAKVFEIASCGSVLFTNANPRSGIQYVFNDSSYVKWKDDYSDVAEKAKWILEDDEARKRIITSAKDEIMTRHTHEIRTQEFIKIVEGL